MCDLEKNINTNVNNKKQIKLWDTQINHFNKIVSIINSFFCYLDTSETGSGKTIVTLYLAVMFSFKIFVVCPASIISIWIKKAKEYSIEVVDCISYAKLRGNNPYVEKILSGNYKVTDKLKNIVNNNTLFIFDESKALCNSNTCNHKCAKTIINAVITNKNINSRVALLTATPGSKIEHFYSYLRLLGIIYSDDLIYPNYIQKNNRYVPNGYVQIGLKEMTMFCRKIKDLTPSDIDLLNYIDKYIFNKNDIKQAEYFCKLIYTQIIRERLLSSAPKKETGYTNDIKDGYYKLSIKNQEKLTEAYNLLYSSVYNKNSNNSDKKKGWALITHSLRLMENAFLDTMVSETISKLNKNKYNKVILYVWYSNTSIPYLEKKLKKYKPLILRGGKGIAKNNDTLSEEDIQNRRNLYLNGTLNGTKLIRFEIASLFQESNQNCRLLICHPQVGGVGLSLDDISKKGEYNRYLYIMNNYNASDIHQAMGRVNRGTTKSNSYCRTVNSVDHQFICEIIRSLYKKSTTHNQLVYQKQSTILPGNYVKVIEYDNN